MKLQFSQADQYTGRETRLTPSRPVMHNVNLKNEAEADQSYPGRKY